MRQTRHPIRFLSKAPANTMIIGEHSVVLGHPAIACALDQWLEIRWQARTDTQVHIDSALAQHQTCIEQLSIHPKLAFVGAALRAFKQAMQPAQIGWDIQIHSEFSSTIGLGSSAAVLAAALSGLNEIYQTRYSQAQLFSIGHRIILDIQGRGSGTDLAASLFGGLLYFQPAQANGPAVFESLTAGQLGLPITLIYSGYKTPTAEVLQMVAQAWKSRPRELEQLYLKMSQLTQTAFVALKSAQLPEFYQACNDYQQTLRELQVSDQTLEYLISNVRQCEAIKAAKISGSGLGDCILAIGQMQQCPEVIRHLSDYPFLTLEISAQGATTTSTQPVQAES